MLACSSSGAKSVVPETFLGTLPPNTTSYTVIDVPSTGIVSVAALAACRAGVAFAMIRSTPSATKLPTIVEQLALSPLAF